MRALLIDAGNTRLKWGIGDNGAVIDTGNVDMAHVHSTGVASLTTRLPHDVDTVFVSNVAGQSLATRLSGVLSSHCGCEVRFARSESSGWGVMNAYPDPRQMGVDRWVAMIAAYAEFGGPVLVVDAGTAVTIDAIDDQGQHLGGQILAGFGLMAAALTRETSDIPAVGGSWTIPQGLDCFGASTEEGVMLGASSAIAGAVEHAIKVLQSAAYDPVLVLTGGDASAMLAAFDADTTHHRPHLVLQGLLHILEHER